MSTTTKTEKFATLKRITEKSFIDSLERAVSESVSDLVVTGGACTAGIAAVMALHLPDALTLWGTVVILLVSVNLLMIRIARKFDQSFTVDELAEMIQAMDCETQIRLNKLLRDAGISEPELERE
jgi:hypothetical protein